MAILILSNNILKFNTDLDQLISNPNQPNNKLFLDFDEKNIAMARSRIDLTKIPFKFAKIIVDNINKIYEKSYR